ncbi:MAG: DNA-3-methyladenine glycosylase 2 family protein [Gemmataceae bacterium]|nr:DNA-3-methyladenine glycosylase 2 family protein [Gemmataceae bacterium]
MLTRARRHLARRDAVLKRLIARVGACTLQVNPDGFAVLARAIVSQQISTKAALSISARLTALADNGGLTAAGILALSEEQLRSAGLSANKVRSIRDLAEKVHSGELPLDGLPQMTDEEAIAHLLPVRGIGRWTAEMFLIFSLGRLDVLPVGDYGLREGVRREYDLPERPGKTELDQLAAPWRPYRSIGTWFIWKSAGPVPQS